MMRLPVLLSGLLLHPVADTVWWRTTIGDVMEHRTGAEQATCTLNLHNAAGRFVFIWDRVLPTRIIVQRNDWTLPSAITMVAMRIDSRRSPGDDGTPDVPALTRATAVMFVVDQPVAGLLADADRIAIRTPEAAFGMSLNPGRMKKLMKAVRRCRAAISR